MRKLLTTVGLVLTAIAGLPVPASADTSTPACPLQGDIVVELTDTRLLGWNEDQNQLGPFPASIPAGTYDVTLASYDEHSAKPDQDHVQPAESWFLTAQATGTEIARSGVIADLPAGQDLLVSSVGQVELTADADSLMAYHAHFDAYNPNSVAPLCARFVPQEPAVVAETPAPALRAAPAVLEAAPPTITSSRGIVAEPVTAVKEIVVSLDAAPADLAIQPQLVQLPVTGFHSGFALAGLLALACGLGLLRIGGSPTLRSEV